MFDLVMKQKLKLYRKYLKKLYTYGVVKTLHFWNPQIQLSALYSKFVRILESICLQSLKRYRIKKGTPAWNV